ncbi:TIGR01777 family oxidoreductase [Paenibacillus cremeus]|uniref:TIGR01777 family protein n=1 Tax=Paenibacillus cremeus TaxID=2163881 RepID=A0A559KD60_9BACL|nr:TIGR01777 family oxidoreductase [Paenibacillus cremeus]TVY10077.1 TIGR01777 family protein [Paenibacillus cremeus]
MKVAITGASGFIGQHLTKYYLEQKASIIHISRDKKKRTENPLIRHMTWSELETNVMPLEGVDAIVNLAGETINQRWTKSAKERIMQSRLDAVARVSSIIERLEKKPVLINASGISIYGSSEENVFMEDSELKVEGFLSQVLDQWEMAAEHIPDTRVVLLRIGIVLGTDGGALPQLMKPFKLGFGGRIGSGRQKMSFIHINDLCRLIDFCIQDEEIEGPVNAVTAFAVSNEEFGRELAKVLKKPYRFPVPAFLLKLMFGEMSTVLLESQAVLPIVANSKGFIFEYSLLEDALKDLLGKEKGR